MSIIYKDKNMEKIEDDIEVIGRGAYGCVFSPNIDCATKQIGNSDFLSKIQENNKVTINEIKIGKKLPQDNSRFAGIKDSCPITVGEIGKETIKKCKLTQKKTGMNLVSNKIHFVGEYTLGQYLEMILEGKDKKTQAEVYLRRIVNTHLYLSHSLEILENSGVIHLDIKSNNIMIDKNTKNPVIIDFGMSYDKSLLTLSNYKEIEKSPFGIAEKYYIPWCMEVIMLSHIGRYIMDHKTKQIVDQKKIGKVIDETEMGLLRRIVSEYMKENTIIKMPVFTNDDRELYKRKMTDWVESMKGKTWSEIWTMITSHSSSWDNYSICVMYLMELDIVGLLKTSNSDFLDKYISELKKTILSTPKERNTPEITTKSLKQLFVKVHKKNHSEQVTSLMNVLRQDSGERKKHRTINENKSIQQRQYMIKKVKNH